MVNQWSDNHLDWGTSVIGGNCNQTRYVWVLLLNLSPQHGVECSEHWCVILAGHLHIR